MVEGLGVGWNCAEKANDLPSGRSEHAQWEAGVLQDEYCEQARRCGGGRSHVAHHSQDRHGAGKS